MSKTLKELKERGRRATKLLFKGLVVRNYNEFYVGPDKMRKKALVSYLVHPLLPPKGFREKKLFSNRGIALEIARGLNELGYVVDVVDYRNTEWRPQQRYELFVGHGALNFVHLCDSLPLGSSKIYFSTGLYWREFNDRVTRRQGEFAGRTGHILEPERLIDLSEEEANSLSDGIICLGNDRVAESYKSFRNVVSINNGAFPLNWSGWSDRDYEASRRNFLFFSGRGNVHKGLDLLLDGFANSDCQLFVCQHIQPEFEHIYSRLLNDRPNIHNLGFIPMRSDAFWELARKCNWVILPTCAEGQPGSVIECMWHGMIPILPDTANIDLEDWGIRIPDLSLEAISSVVDEVTRMEPMSCRERAERVKDAARSKYTADQFRFNFKNAVRQIVAA